VKFKSGTRRRTIEYEKALIEYWKKNNIFEKSIERRSAENSYVFYDGPPFITGVPHHGTLLSSIVKDAVPRYWTMKGKRVERVWGWDCHGLPAEVFTEKKLGIHDRRDIGTKISLEEYITTARDNMVQTSSLWNDTIDRIGRWVDMDRAYKTMDKEYMESIWWAFKELHSKGKIYEGERVLMYCTRDATPLSKAEVTMDAGAYQDVTDPSVYVKFRLNDGSTLLAWTTTPWTLPANTAVAVNKDLHYVEVELGSEKFIIAKELVQKVLTDEKHQSLDYTVVRELKGSELVGKTYEPLFDDRGKGAHKVWAADYVSAEDGSGIVHIAPAYGEEDFALAQEQSIPVVHVIDENGLYTETQWHGQNVWECNKAIAKALLERGVVWKIDYFRHPYPHCHRCGTRLMYRAHPSWFFNVQDQKQLMLDKNDEQINWFPEHLKHGRFEKNIEQAPDWNLSRDRFWATAMPVWEGTDNNGNKKQIVVGSYGELKDLSGVELDDYHRPWVDEIEFDKDGVHYKRIEKVLDGWFESGSMPFAQFHYPFENKEKFDANFPGDFIVEYIGQVRAWFYYMHVVSIGLFGESSFRNVITTGTLAGNDGRKMSKSYGNFTDPNELMDTFGADSLRFLLMSSPVLSGEDFALQDKDVGNVARKLSMIWNMYDFFSMYAEVDGWEFDPDKQFSLNPEDLINPLDKWVVSRVHQLNEHVTKHMDDYNLPVTLSEFLPFIEDASNWYVRRSRRRFWKSDDDSDKSDAYRTLHYVLMKLSVIIAPFAPFLAEELYQKLGGGSESVHLLDWPTNYTKDEKVLTEMATVREYVNQALSLRATQRIKIRQPLASVSVPSVGEVINFEDILKDELNVKEVLHGKELSLDFELTPALKREGYIREVIRHVQAARKDAGLKVDDRILLTLQTGSADLLEAISEHVDVIKQETLAVELGKTPHQFSAEVKIDDILLHISLQQTSL
jgi:isoleucyl-tRNA synthetase